METKHDVFVLQAPLSRSIWAEYTKLNDYICLIPEKELFIKQLEGTGGKVSVIDLIAYQRGWGNLLISWYHKGLQGSPFTMPGDGFATWDYTALAQHFYEKYQAKTGKEAQEQFLQVVLAIIDLTEDTHTAGTLNAYGKWPWCTLKSGTHWPLSKWITVNTIAPYKRAHTILKKHFKFPRAALTTTGY